MRIPESANLMIASMIVLCVATIIVNPTHAGIDAGTIELLLLFDKGVGEVAEDSSGNGRDGEIIGGVDWADGKFGKALEFNGVDGYVITNGYFGVGGTDPRTTAFWWKTDDNVSRHSWVKGGTNVAGQKYYLRGDDTVGGSITLRVEVNGGQHYGSTNVCDGKWHHLAVVFPDGSDSVKDHLLYVDGILEAQTAGGDQNMDTDNTTTDIRIGGQIPGVGQHEFAKGIMDELAIFNVALTEDEINTIMKGLDTVLAVGGTDRLATTWAETKTRY